MFNLNVVKIEIRKKSVEILLILVVFLIRYILSFFFVFLVNCFSLIVVDKFAGFLLIIIILVLFENFFMFIFVKILNIVVFDIVGV